MVGQLGATLKRHNVHLYKRGRLLIGLGRAVQHRLFVDSQIIIDRL
jgi:hypothetical protein